MSLIYPRYDKGRDYSHILYRSYIYLSTRGKHKQSKFQVPVLGEKQLYNYDNNNTEIKINATEEEEEIINGDGDEKDNKKNDIGFLEYKEDDVVKCYYAFSLNPLLTTRFWEQLCVEDRFKLIAPADAKQLWLLAILEGIEVNNSAIIPCSGSSELVEISGRTVIQQKLNETYKRKWGQIPSLSLLPKRSLISIKSDDRIPSLPIFILTDTECDDFFNTCLNTIWCQTKIKELFNSKSTINNNNNNNHSNRKKIMKSRCFSGIWTFPYIKSSYIVPYALLSREIDYERDNNIFALVKDTSPTKWLLQVTALLPINEYNARFGTPCSPKESPFTFSIGENIYCDTFEKFYVFHHSIYQRMCEDL